jgi:IS6 family transposase
MSVFKRRRFPAEIILLCVRWYCRYGISYRDLEDLMAERGVAVDHTTLCRWVQRFLLPVFWSIIFKGKMKLRLMRT